MDVKNAVISLKNRPSFDKGFKIWLFQAFKERWSLLLPMN
ncbi:hypothetical protein C789_5268 [Microcystis aeruginosa FACHB-905 = DIANCHI905]|nr:hypothetical protein C789_5268 [Microcystis aeruginosa FACHB-905 = DIANCHI905]